MGWVWANALKILVSTACFSVLSLNVNMFYDCEPRPFSSTASNILVFLLVCCTSVRILISELKRTVLVDSNKLCVNYLQKQNFIFVLDKIFLTL